MLSLNGISKIYRTEDVETLALNEINMEVRDGEFLAIMGPSGCGKSTLLNIIGMLDNPSSGSYRFHDQEIAGYPESRLAQLRKRSVGFIFQNFNLIDTLSVAENVELGLLYNEEVPAADRRRRVAKVLEKMNIAHRARHMPAQLSGGQQQRVAVARALVAEPDLILADEPAGNLDSHHGDEVMEMLGQLNAEGSTIVMVTHSRAHAERAGRVLNLLDGCVVDNRAQMAM